MLMDMHTMLVTAVTVMCFIMFVGGILAYAVIRVFYRLYITAEKRYMLEKKYRQEDNETRYKEFLEQFNSINTEHHSLVVQALAECGLLDRRSMPNTKSIKPSPIKKIKEETRDTVEH